MIDHDIQLILEQETRTYTEALMLAKYFDNLDFFDKLQQNFQESTENLQEIKV